MDGDPRGGGLPGELRDAVTLRAALLIVGVLALQLAFILSYVGAFHDPEPEKMPLAIVAPEDLGAQLSQQLDELPGSPLDAGHQATDEADARLRIERREIDGALLVDPEGSTDRLLVASGAGASLADALERVVSGAQESQGRAVQTEDIVPASSGDNRGLSPFYLVVGWCVGGYLCAAVLAISVGARPANTSRAATRLLVLALYAVAGGLGGALIIGPLLDSLPGSVLGLAGLGALIVFATGATTLALQGIFGIAGVGLAILLVVVLGNPSAGGAYAGPLLPAFWQHIGPTLIPGAGTWAARSIAYFHGHAIAAPLLVLTAWSLTGVVLTLLAAVLRTKRDGHLEASSSPAHGSAVARG